jgi:hypothetical protein
MTERFEGRTPRQCGAPALRPEISLEKSRDVQIICHPSLVAPPDLEMRSPAAGNGRAKKEEVKSTLKSNALPSREQRGA